MDRDRRHDLIVVGGGLAGLTAAARASEGGLSVLVVEQGSDARYPCNSRYSGGILHFAYQDVRSEPAKLAAVVRRAMGEDANEDLIEASARRAGPALDWLSRFDVRFVKSSPVEWHRWTLAPPRPLQPGLDFPGSGPDRLLGLLSEAIRACGGEILLAHRATDLAREDGLWVLTAACAGETRRFPAKAVLLAEGGFQGDAELVRRHISARPERLVQRGAGTGQGFAVRVADKLGCGLTRMDRFYGHVLSRDALENPRLWPYPQLDPLAANGIVVGPEGKRFVDEGRGGVFIANELAGLADPAAAFAIIDAAIWESAGRQSLYPANPHLERAGGAWFRAETVSALAQACGIDATALERTVSTYNHAAEAGANALFGLDVPRSGHATALRGGPFIGIPLVPGITDTMGGLAVDGQARVLDRQGKAMRGLYAAGAAAGGLEGGRHVGYVGGLMRALTSGLAAADDLIANSGKAAHPATPSPVATQPKPTMLPARAKPIVLRALARHPIAISTVASLISLAIVFVLAWPIIALLALVPAVGIAAIVFVLAKAFCELAAIILDTLAPD